MLKFGKEKTDRQISLFRSYFTKMWVKKWATSPNPQRAHLQHFLSDVCNMKETFSEICPGKANNADRHAN